MNKQRLFIAVLLEDSVKEEIYKVIEEIKPSSANVEWTAFENLHVTVKFLGDTDPSKIGEIVKSIEDSCSQIAPFDLEISGVGTFQRGGNPSIIWTGITSGAEELALLANNINNNLSYIGFEKDKHLFMAHITIGRIKSANNNAVLKKKVGLLENRFIIKTKINNIALMRSDLKPTGPIYTMLKSIELMN